MTDHNAGAAAERHREPAFSRAEGSDRSSHESSTLDNWPFLRRGPIQTLVAFFLAYVAIFALLHAVGPHVTLPGAPSTTPASDSLENSLARLLGQPATYGVDFGVDYASAHAMVDGRDAYGLSPDFLKSIGMPPLAWGSNTHPPTALLLVLPFTLLPYWTATAAWTLAMVFALVATLRLVDVPYKIAIPAGLGLGITFPGAWGIANVVPVIGLGVALAYRYRYQPVLGGLGIALAAVPKFSGLILILPFLLAGRIRLVLYAVGFWLVAAALPLFWQPDVWSRYETSGVADVNANAARPDNAGLLAFAHHRLGLTTALALVLIAAATVAVALAKRELFWPTVWAMVAALPVAWMYSLLTLIPLVGWTLVRSGHVRAVIALSLLALTLMVTSPPGGDVPTVVFPIVALLTLLICISAQPGEATLWLSANAKALAKRRFAFFGGIAPQRSDDVVRRDSG